MKSDATAAFDPDVPAGASRRKIWLRVGGLALWGVVLTFVSLSTWSNPNAINLTTAGVFYVLFAVVNAQIYLVQWTGRRNFRRLDAKIKGAGYISELGGLPNRNYLLAELRREMPRARAEGTPFSLLVLSLESLDEVRERRGDDFADRALHGMVELLRRSTRNSDFLAHLGGARFCALLVECDTAGALTYLKRMVGHVAVSDGRRMLDVPITARMAEYDMESVYATDVLGAAEDAQPLRRKVVPHPDSKAA